MQKAKNLKDYILGQNLQAEFFTVAGVNCWQGKLKPVEQWESDYGITTVEQLEAYLDECAGPTPMEEYNQWFDEMIARQEEQDKRNIKENTEKYCQNKPCTYNPFEILKESVKS